MQKICDICHSRAAERFDRVVENGSAVEYAYCEACYNRAVKSGVLPQEEARRSIARLGKECPVCGYTAEEFTDTLLFGCPDCYRYMREVATDAVERTQGGWVRGNANLQFVSPKESQNEGFKSADECSIDDLTRDNVVSSRIRLARNVNGLEFTNFAKDVDLRFADMIKGAKRAADAAFDARLFTMSELSDTKKKVLLERHFISLPLANNLRSGAVIIEKGDRPQMSIMLGEEDHIREQCVIDGHSLGKAYARIKEYDARLARELDLAYDGQFGYLTACPTNVGTGMRASEMLFLPALRRAGAIDDAIKTFKDAYGLTVRGYFGEDSDSAYDMYQISNSRTYGVSEQETLYQVEQAVVRMCYCERVALEKLVREQKTSLIDGIFRSYAVLTGAYSLNAQELMKLLVDVKIGVILGVLPIKSTRVLNKIIEQCSSSLEIITNGISDDERNRTRAQIVKDILSEEKL
ncbi:MAG: hypothetical protein NC037_03225 [Bacteroides sp.]|nr:hypothetical protein [Bacillota bacterium]MCM1393786.1 hypothetical protein [[Eubacterium] siraeum]MCM1455520.1 hypothetical protein [Bacteroides sp.]